MSRSATCIIWVKAIPTTGILVVETFGLLYGVIKVWVKAISTTGILVSVTVGLLYGVTRWRPKVRS